MTSAKYTPGPWAATPSDPAEGVECIWITACPAPNQEKEIAAVYGPQNERNQATACLIAAAPDMHAALDGLVMVCGRTGDAYADFEEQADAFHKETGWMRPGKSMPMELRDERSNDDARRERYAAWVASKIDAARAALSKAGV